jgi:hypothetical protein
MNDHDAENYTYIEHDLNELYNIEVDLDRLVSSKTEAYDNLITEEIRLQMIEIDEKYDRDIAEVEERLVQLRAITKEGVLDLGRTVQGEHMMAVWNKGRVSWDTAALKGYAVTHPKVNLLRKVGKPSVTIRKVK